MDAAYLSAIAALAGTVVGGLTLISRMRILSSPNVIDEADKVAQLIVDSYLKPKKTLSELRDMVHERSLDPLRDFSEYCREVLQGLPPL